MTAYVIPLIFLTVLLMSFFKKKNGYSVFIDGSKSALSLMADVFPFLLTVMMAVELFKASGVSAWVSNAAAPVMNFFGIPKDCAAAVGRGRFGRAGQHIHPVRNGYLRRLVRLHNLRLQRNDFLYFLDLFLKKQYKKFALRYSGSPYRHFLGLRFRLLCDENYVTSDKYQPLKNAAI